MFWPGNGASIGKSTAIGASIQSGCCPGNGASIGKSIAIGAISSSAGSGASAGNGGNGVIIVCPGAMSVIAPGGSRNTSTPGNIHCPLGAGVGRSTRGAGARTGAAGGTRGVCCALTNVTLLLSAAMAHMIFMTLVSMSSIALREAGHRGTDPRYDVAFFEGVRDKVDF